MTDLDFFTVCVSVKSRALRIAFEPVSTICIRLNNKMNYSYSAK